MFLFLSPFLSLYNQSTYFFKEREENKASKYLDRFYFYVFSLLLILSGKNFFIVATYSNLPESVYIVAPLWNSI